MFLAALAACGNVSHSARAASVGRGTAYEHRKTDPEFAAAWAEATRSRTTPWKLRAVEGVNELVVYQGQVAGVWIGADGNPTTKETQGAKFVPLTVKKYSDTLLIFLLKANRPEKFRERIGIGGDSDARPVKLEHSGEVSVVERLDALTDAFARAVAREEGGGVPGDDPETPLDF